MITFVDNFLNSITMYRLLLYYLILLLSAALIYSILGVFPFEPIPFIFSVTILVGVSFVSNKALERIFNVQTNVESLYITALILALIITPPTTIFGILFLVIAAFLAMASKYILNIAGKHIFNPAAIAILITGFTINRYASWWVGTLAMFPFVLFGILIVRKIRRFDLVFYFIISALVFSFGLSFMRGNMNIFTILRNSFIDSPLLFFAFVMLTEPLTTPPTKFLQSVYGGIVGILFSPIHLGIFFTTPEIALSIGNIFSYLVSPKEKLILKLKEKTKLTDDVYDFVFTADKKLNFKAGQYLEWTFGHKNTDTRGNRRYFTIASSPTENEIRIGIKFSKKRGSSFKREISDMKIGDKIVASQLAGDFTMPKDTGKFVFIAGGVGITPFRSMIKYLIDTNQKMDIVLMYSDKKTNDFVYKDVFKKAVGELGLKAIYFETEKEGRMTADVIKKRIPDYKERIFFLSGPHGMVSNFEKSLAEMKLPKKQIKVDYFPGF